MAEASRLLRETKTKIVDIVFAVGNGVEVSINDLAAAGKAVIVISSELPEVLGISDRILVMRGGKITGEVTDVAAATQEAVMALAT